MSVFFHLTYFNFKFGMNLFCLMRVHLLWHGVSCRVCKLFSLIISLAQVVLWQITETNKQQANCSSPLSFCPESWPISSNGNRWTVIKVMAQLLRSHLECFLTVNPLHVKSFLEYWRYSSSRVEEKLKVKQDVTLEQTQKFNTGD